MEEDVHVFPASVVVALLSDRACVEAVYPGCDANKSASRANDIVHHYFTGAKEQPHFCETEVGTPRHGVLDYIFPYT
ncbi:hypothetical protein ASF96_02970 [Microbacterium sp. Leaf179]|nr:hypothetical protein ASF96_02970 [Microbacterium sp. Leaf179]